MSISIEINNNQISPLLKLDLTAKKGPGVKLTFVNSTITNELIETLCNKKITDLVFKDCIMPEETAELFAPSKKSVQFLSCILTDLETVSDRRISFLFHKSKDTLEIYNSHLLELAENFSELTLEMIEKLKAPEEQTQSLEMNRENELFDQITLGKEVINKLHAILVENQRILEFFPLEDFPKIFNKYMEKGNTIRSKIMNINKLIERHNQSADCVEVLLGLIIDAIKDCQSYIEERQTESFTPTLPGDL